MTSDDVALTDVNLNNVSGIEEKKICEIFDSLRKNNNLDRLSLVNCDVSLGHYANFQMFTLFIKWRWKWKWRQSI